MAVRQPSDEAHLKFTTYVMPLKNLFDLKDQTDNFLARGYKTEM